MADNIIHFSLGEAVAAFGLIFAVFQLKDKSWDIVLKIRDSWQRNLIWYMGVGGLVSIAIAITIQQKFFSLPLSFLNNTFLWQFLGYLCFIFAPLSLLLFGKRKKGLFNKRRAEKFYNIILREITKPKIDNIDVCIDILGANLENITKALAGISSIPFQRDKDYILSDEEKYAIYANAVTTVILSEERVARYIATGRIDFILYLLATFKKYRITSAHTQLGLDRIIELLFREESSYFYSQLDYRGTSLALNAFEAIFSEPYFLDNFCVFGNDYSFCKFDRLHEKYLAVYLKSLEYAIKGYWENNCPVEMRREICNGLDKLNDYSQSLAFSSKEKNKHKEAVSRLQTISFFLGHTYIREYKEALKRKQASIYETEVKKDNEFRSSINFAYAKTVCGFIESLAQVKEEYNGKIRILAMETVGETIPLHSLTSGFEKLSETIIGLIWEKINGDFMSNVKGFFPSVLKVYLYIIGFKVNGTEVSIVGKERKKMIEFLYKDIKPKILSGELMADKKTTFEEVLLPVVTFDKKNQKFLFKLDDGDGQIME